MKLNVLFMSAVVASVAAVYGSGVATAAPLTPVEDATLMAVQTKAKTKGKANRNNANVEREVKKIISIINKQAEDVKFMMNNGTPAASSMALRWSERQPDYRSRIKKIKNQLSSEQAARIKAAENRLHQLIDQWQDMPMGY